MQMNSYRYSVRKINLFPLAKFGCVLGGLAMVIPGVICGIVSMQLVSFMRAFLDEWQTSELQLLGLGVQFDFIEILGLEATQNLLIQLDEQGVVLALLIVLSSIIGGGLFIALMIMLVGWGYNLLAALTGGLEVELRG